ncbi:DUF4245 domain-containing protein [Nocardia inohanensis]|uniref:DUF4245 domain-containing protein n=1 Tax=Nocardia inohanensis TaxID=209246 RepID=UPI000829BFE9|nr:DUF4245 domain-containing protein [Nocardia inohanensis]
MSYQKPRTQHDYKDLIWSLLPLLLICLVIAGIASQCSFQTGGPKQGQIPEFKVHDSLTVAARELSFPIREPAVPGDWTPNSGSRADVTGGGKLATVGYITNHGAYMQLTQSDATEDKLAAQIVGSRYATGTEQIGDRKWVVYGEADTEPAWITDFGDVRVLIKGAGNKGSFMTLATAVGNAQPLPKK